MRIQRIFGSPSRKINARQVATVAIYSCSIALQKTELYPITGNIIYGLLISQLWPPDVSAGFTND